MRWCLRNNQTTRLEITAVKNRGVVNWCEEGNDNLGHGYVQDRIHKLLRADDFGWKHEPITRSNMAIVELTEGLKFANFTSRLCVRVLSVGCYDCSLETCMAVVRMGSFLKEHYSLTG